MTPEKYEQLTELFHAALEVGSDQRAAFLLEVCAGDAELRRELDSLLAAHEQGAHTAKSPADIAAGLYQAQQEQGAASGVAREGALAPHTRLDRYEIRSLLGKGGMGEVYLAQDTRMPRNVALKILPAALAQDAGRIRRFVQEAKAASALNHPNILTIYEDGEFENLKYIASEYVEGETLSERLLREPLNLKGALDVAVQIASALQAAHAAGIVHRDIKPDNVMIRPDGVVKLLDFGIAKLTEQKIGFSDAEAATAIKARTSPGVIIGTAAYMSPEQARGKAVDARSDIFSFGLVLYEMVTGKRAFAGENAMDVISSILQKEPVPLRRLVPDVPHEIERIVGKALRKDCEERYQTAKDLLIDLKDAQQELVFQHKLERGAVPYREQAETQIINALTNDSPQTTSNAQYLAAKITNHKLAAIAALLALTVGIAALYYFTRGNVSNKLTNNDTIDSIAVLPLINAAQDPNAEYLSDGITESLINRLSQLSGLKVMSSSSVARYKGKEQDAQKIGNELSVRAVLTGNVKQIGDQLVINVSLDGAKDNRHIWGEQYVRKFADVLAIQNEIAQEVSTNLRLQLTGADKQQLAKRYTDNVAAYQLYLKGMYEWNKHTQEDLQKSIQYFNQAIELDPNYALAYVGLCASYGVLGNNYLPPNEAYPKAKAYAAKALALDATLAEAHSSMGANRLYYDWNWAEAQSEFKRAQTLDPNNAGAHHLYADSLEIMGRFDETKVERKRALELDSLSPIFNMAAGATFYFARQNDEAIAQYQKTIDLEPRFVDTYFYLGQAYEQKKLYAQAIAAYQKGISQAERSPFLIAALGHAYALSGDRDKANKALDELREMSRRSYVSPYLFAVVYVGLGDKEQAFASLDKAVQDRSFFLIWLKVEPLFDPLRADPRFQDLLQRIGLPQSP
jgi:serine/threonine protein kinase/Flp pilus assembly protein TadD